MELKCSSKHISNQRWLLQHSPSIFSVFVQGIVVSSIQWGAWAGSGMAASSSALIAKLQRSGLDLVQPVNGLNALGIVLPICSFSFSLSSLVSIHPLIIFWETANSITVTSTPSLNFRNTAYWWHTA